MPPDPTSFRLRHLLLAGAVLLPLAAPARAQGDDSATVKLIQILISKGILTKDQAASLLTQAQSEARAPKPARPAGKAGGTALATAEPPAPEVPKGTVRVTYVPQSVRDQIAAQVRDQVLGETEKKGWAAPGALPEWTKRITIYGDLRLRGERVLQDPANKTSVSGSEAFPFTDFNAINQGAPFDRNNGSSILPTLNTTENRTRYRLRARLGAKAEIDDWISTDIRLATGNDNSPVTTNQTLGQNTNFGKYSIWLDRAYALLKVPPRAKFNTFSTLQAYVGRFGNPFWTTDLVYSDDLNFDGGAVQAVAPIAPGLNGWVTAGAFQVYNTDFNYSNRFDTLAGKQPSRDKYLFAAQAGVDYKPAPAIITKFAAGWFNYQNVEGRLSSECFPQSAIDACSTDNSRPQFLQYGNTVFPIRNVIQGTPTYGLTFDTQGRPTTFGNPQYFGLASRFSVLDLHGRVQFTRYDPVNVELEGEYSKNLAFNRTNIVNKGPQNNLGAGTDLTYQGGDTAWMAKIKVGKLEITKKNDWDVYFGYKYLESDAVLDAFTDNSFHFGGTNAKGFVTGVDYGIGRNTYVSAKWLSANQVSGPTYRNDIVQIDLNTKF